MGYAVPPLIQKFWVSNAQALATLGGWVCLPSPTGVSLLRMMLLTLAQREYIESEIKFRLLCRHGHKNSWCDSCFKECQVIKPIPPPKKCGERDTFHYSCDTSSDSKLLHPVTGTYKLQGLGFHTYKTSDTLKKMRRLFYMDQKVCTLCFKLYTVWEKARYQEEDTPLWQRSEFKGFGKLRL